MLTTTETKAGADRLAPHLAEVLAEDERARLGRAVAKLDAAAPAFAPEVAAAIIAHTGADPALLRARILHAADSMRDLGVPPGWASLDAVARFLAGEDPFPKMTTRELPPELEREGRIADVARSHLAAGRAELAAECRAELFRIARDAWRSDTSATMLLSTLATHASPEVRAHLLAVVAIVRTHGGGEPLRWLDGHADKLEAFLTAPKQQATKASATTGASRKDAKPKPARAKAKTAATADVVGRLP